MIMCSLVEYVKKYAAAHYEDGGWDVIVECWTDGEIAERLGDATTEAEALAAFRDLVDVWADRQAYADNERDAAIGPDDV
jgi:hypothetical protein